MTRPTPVMWLAAVLDIKCGEQARDGRWLVQPTASYVCHRCGTTEGPVTGKGPVIAFVEHVKTIHAGRCPAQTK